MMLLQYYFLIFFIKKYVMGFHVDASTTSSHNICFYKEVDKKYTDCNLKAT